MHRYYDHKGFGVTDAEAAAAGAAAGLIPGGGMFAPAIEAEVQAVENLAPGMMKPAASQGFAPLDFLKKEVLGVPVWMLIAVGALGVLWLSMRRHH